MLLLCSWCMAYLRAFTFDVRKISRQPRLKGEKRERECDDPTTQDGRNADVVHPAIA